MRWLSRWILTAVLVGSLGCADSATLTGAPADALSGGDGRATDTRIGDPDVTSDSREHEDPDLGSIDVGSDLSGPGDLRPGDSSPDAPGDAITDLPLETVGDIVGDNDARALHDAPIATDDAVVVTVALPSALACGASFDAAITLQNTGSATWRRDDGYKLGAVDDSDPFFDVTRVWLSEDVEVPTGATHTFSFILTAPETAGTYDTDWQMVHESVRWFGQVAEASVVVTCDDTPPSGPPDLGAVTWLHTDVSGWPQTSTLSSVTVSADQICMDYDRANVWPIVTIGGDTDVVGNPWIFIWRDDRWYAGTWEWLRPGQTCKARTSVAGDHIKRSPFDAASGWVPTPGVTYYFMVSGLARASERNVEERTNLMPVVWPD